MNIDKTITMTLNNREVYLLKAIARHCANDLNDMFREERKLWDLTSSEMHEMDYLARSLADL